ncbi:MAG: RHS repeat-associated core domain-containing protein, partial [Pirellulaceae bacterium]|nr:RHS repeat-associated core domain-containing protein [Pirellulaceae bacterium]
EYDASGRLATMIAYNAKGDNGAPYTDNIEAQAPAYLYESAVNASWQTAVVYPDSTDTISQDGDGVWSITTGDDHTETTQDRLGRTVTATDQRGVEHTYTYDSAGRVAHDSVTSLGSSGVVDDAILRISTTYDDTGRVQTLTSYDDPDPGEGNVVNQVRYAYNGWGNLIEEWQAHDSAVDMQTTPSVQYAYEDGASGSVAKYVRLAEVTYPGGQAIEYGYGTTGAIDDIMSRLSDIGDGTDTYASYKYLGAGTIVEEDYEDIAVKLDYAADDFAALDRFGRVLEQIWTDYGADPDAILDHYSYTYDRMGNRTAKDNELHAAFDEVYTYDGLNRLTLSERADDYDQSWTLDGQGNFTAFDDDGDSQSRETNAANEIENITGGWVTPVYDAAGNMIYGPKSGDETTGLHFVRDAWNRQIAVFEDDGDGVYEPSTDDTLIGEYEFDAANRRIEKVLSASHAHYFYNNQWQMLEERFVDGQGATISANQHVFSPEYIDSPIVWRHDANGDGDYADQGDLHRYYLSDANHNTTAVVDSVTGLVVKRYVYNAYGAHTVYDPDWTNPTAPVADGILYCGYWYDAETGNYQVRAREYVTCLSTFDTRDPAESDINLYRYVGNNPVIYVDPLGLWGDEGHNGMPNLPDCNGNNTFDWTKEDYGWTNPIYPWSTWRHFRDLPDVEADLANDVASCNKAAFERHMHQGQDYYSHYLPGWRWWIGGHIWGWHEPDNIATHNEQYLNAKYFTSKWLAIWAAHCSQPCTPPPSEQCPSSPSAPPAPPPSPQTPVVPPARERAAAKWADIQANIGSRPYQCKALTAAMEYARNGGETAYAMELEYIYNANCR